MVERMFFSYQPTTAGALEDLEVTVTCETSSKDWLIHTADAVMELNRTLREIAAEVDGRKTRDGWELEDGWKVKEAD